MSIIKPYELYKFVYRRLDGNEYVAYIVSEHFPQAFNRMYMSYGEDIKIISVEVLANEQVDLVIDPTYTKRLELQQQESVIIRGMQDYDIK